MCGAYPQGQAPSFTRKYLIGLEKRARDKRSSLFGVEFSDKYKRSMLLRVRINITKLFLLKSNQAFCKLDLFTTLRQILCTLIKRVSKITPKKFYNFETTAHCYKTFYGRD